MTPALLCLVGPLKGSKIPLGREEVVIGRDRANNVFVGDLLLSRKHCSVSMDEAGAFRVRDLDSLNGVFVNGIPVRDHRLAHGDNIEIGSSLFLFLTHDDTIAAPPLIHDTLQARSTITIRVEDSLLKEKDASEKSLEALLRISTELNGSPDSKIFSERLLSLIFEAAPCDRAFLLLGKPGTPIIVDSKLKHAGTSTDGISRTVCEQALSQKVAVLSSDLNDESDSGLKIQSVICVPFLWMGRVAALLYLDTSNPAGKFQQNHLQLASAIVALGSPAYCHLQEEEELSQRNRLLEEELSGGRRLIGESAALIKVLEKIGKVARSDSTVLIRGESGTGKELAARAIHSSGARSQGPFVAINCAALPESLLESELFGHEKGSFTGALSQKKGKIEIAEGGTLFLDEIGELSPVLQAKLLRVLQEHEFERVGGLRTIPVDIRVLTATNKNLESGVKDGSFRQDLFYRLNVVSLEMPALREMTEDIVLLSQYFVSRISKRVMRRVQGISPEAKACLLQYDWPGNVRELENAIERAVVLGCSEWILPEDLPEAIVERKPASSGGTQPGGDYHEAILQRKRELVQKAFEGTNGNYNEAALKLGLHPNYLYRLVRNLKLPDF